MQDLEIQISGDDSIIDLNLDSFSADLCLSIHNDLLNPADTLYLIVPKTKDKLKWQSAIKTDDLDLDLMILLNNDTYIHNGSFKDFSHVMITNHSILERTNSSISLDDNKSYDVKLIIENFRTSKGLLFCSHLALIASGIVKDFLSINLEAKQPQLKLVGIDDKERFTVGNLEINSNIKKLTMSNVLVNENFTHKNIAELFIENTLINGNFHLSNIGNVIKLEVDSTGDDNKINCDKIIVGNLFTPQGKFYIAAKSFINFKINDGGRLTGIDLVLDMSNSVNKLRKISFPLIPFKFEEVLIIGASEVNMPKGGFCKKLTFENCEKAGIWNILAKDMIYKITNKPGLFVLQSSEVAETLIVNGEVNISISNFKAQNVETYGLCRLNLSGDILIKMLKFNLNLNVANLNDDIPRDSSAITIDNINKDKVQIDNILAKLSTLHIKGAAKLGSILIVPIEKIPTLFWIEMTGKGSLQMDRLFVGGNHDVIIRPDGSINIIQNHNILKGSSFYASVSSTKAKDYIYIKAGKGIRFDGKIHVINAVGLFTESGDIIINGNVVSNNSMVINTKQGEIITTGSTLKAKSIAVYSGSNSYFQDTLIQAQNLVAYSLNGSVQISQSQIKSCNIVIVGKGDVSIDSSKIESSKSYIKSGQNVNISNSDYISHSIFVQAIHDFLQINSNITLVQHPHILFANQLSSDTSIIKGGVKIATDVNVIGIYGEKGMSFPTSLSWQQVGDISKVNLKSGNAYIEANRGFIIGSSLNANNSVIIKTHSSIEVVPLTLYNETIDSGGLNKKSISEVVSKINAGLIDIKAKNSAIFIGSLLKAATGKIDADVLYSLDSPTNIEKQQERINVLKDFMGLEPLKSSKTVGDYFNFSKATYLASRISNLSIYDDYSSSELYFTKKQGDISLDKSISKYDKLHVTASNGKILITSPNLQDIYKGSGGGDSGKQACKNARTVIAGKEVYLIADEIRSTASKINVSGELKIVTKDGVHILPVSVHQSLVHHSGSKFTTTEKSVRLVVSEINAGFLDIKAGGAFTAVSALIKATGVNLDVNELNLLSEREIFEKRIVFQGKEKWHGGSNSSTDYFRDEIVIPTLIKSDKMHAKVNGKTTIEAAQILIKEESKLISGGDVAILAKYDIHVHDHVSKKSYLFKCHKGKVIVAGTKTVKEHFYGESPVPTIYYNKGDFYGCSDGKIHVLGSKIIANNLHLVAKKGVKLEAASFHQEKVVTISEQGLRMGFSSGGGTHSFDAELFSELEKKQFKNKFHESTELIARNNLVLRSEKDVEIISSKLNFKKAKIKASNLLTSTHFDTNEMKQDHISMSVGLHMGVQESISGTVDKIKKLSKKEGKHWLDKLDYSLNGYEVIKDIQSMYEDTEKLKKLDKNDPDSNQSIIENLGSIKYGVWAGGKASRSFGSSLQNIAIDNIIIGGDLDINVSQNAIIEGIKCDVDNLELKANNLYTTASHDTRNSDSGSLYGSFTVPIYGTVGYSASMGFNKSESSSFSYHSDNHINVKNNLKIDIKNNAEIKGVKVIGNTTDISANNLLVESLQDSHKERSYGASVNIGISNQDTKSFGSKLEKGTTDGAWTEAFGQIIGRESIKVNVTQKLEIKGGLIANADIKENSDLIDKGNLDIQAKEIITKTLYDYNDSYNYEVGFSLSKGIDSNTGKNKYGVGLPIAYGFNENSRTILSTIGNGSINSQKIEGVINRSVNNYIIDEFSESASLDANIPISDILEALKPVSGVNAGDTTEGKINGKDEKEKLEEQKEIESSDNNTSQSDNDQKESTNSKPDLQRITDLAILGAMSGSNKLTIDGGQQINGITIGSPDKIVPIFDINNNQQKSVSNSGGISYVLELFGISSANANPAVVPAGIAGYELGTAIISAITTWKIFNDSKEISNLMNHNNAPEGSYRPALTGDPIDQMKFDDVITDSGTYTSYSSSIKNQVKEESKIVAEKLSLAIGNRCDETQKLPDPELARQYLVTATDAYNIVSFEYGFNPINLAQKGRHIHTIAESLAKYDKALYENNICSGEYPFEIETSYLKNEKINYRVKGSSVPDLFNESTGKVYDWKTGKQGTIENRHNNNVINLPTKTGFVTTCDVRTDGVICPYSTPKMKK
jgi:hypothetical protein